MWTVPRIVIFLELADASCSLNSVNTLFQSLFNDPERPNNMNVDVARDFVDVVFHVLLDGTKATHKPPGLLLF